MTTNATITTWPRQPTAAEYIDATYLTPDAGITNKARRQVLGRLKVEGVWDALDEINGKRNAGDSRWISGPRYIGLILNAYQFASRAKDKIGVKKKAPKDWSGAADHAETIADFIEQRVLGGALEITSLREYAQESRRVAKWLRARAEGISRAAVPINLKRKQTDDNPERRLFEGALCKSLWKITRGPQIVPVAKTTHFVYPTNDELVVLIEEVKQSWRTAQKNCG